MKDQTASVSVSIEMWDGTAWFPVAVREGPYAYVAISNTEEAIPICPVMEQYIPVSAFHTQVTGARTFRIRATSAYAIPPVTTTPFPPNPHASAYVTRVKGFAVGLR